MNGDEKSTMLQMQQMMEQMQFQMNELQADAHQQGVINQQLQTHIRQQGVINHQQGVVNNELRHENQKLKAHIQQQGVENQQLKAHIQQQGVENQQLKAHIQQQGVVNNELRSSILELRSYGQQTFNELKRVKEIIVEGEMTKLIQAAYKTVLKKKQLPKALYRELQRNRCHGRNKMCHSVFDTNTSNENAFDLIIKNATLWTTFVSEKETAKIRQEVMSMIHSKPVEEKLHYPEEVPELKTPERRYFKDITNRRVPNSC